VAPSVQRRKVWLTPTTRCRAVTLARCEISWNLQGYPKLVNRSRCKYRMQKVVKKSSSGHHRTTLSGYIFATKARINNWKNLLSSNTFSKRSHNMVNFGPLAAEIGLVVWGAPANLNRFRVLAALLHGSLVVGVSQTLRHWTEGATYIRQGGHHVGIGPHSSFFSSTGYYCFVLLNCSCHNFNILLYGVGSKRHIINDFITSKLSDVPHVVVNGFFPSLTIKRVSLIESFSVILINNFLQH